MAIIIKETEKKKDITLEPKLVKQLQDKVTAFDGIWEDNDDVRKDIPGVQQAKHVVGTEYNTDNKNKQSGQISNLEAKRIINHAKTDQNGKSVFNQLFSPEIMNDIKAKLKQTRTQQQPTLPQKDNNKTATQVPTPNVKEVKPVKANSAIRESCSHSDTSFEDFVFEISESKRRVKKIYLNESQLHILKEYRDQLILPLDGDDNKMNYEHFIDWIEEDGQYGQLPTFQGDIQDLIAKHIADVYEEYRNNECDIETDFDDFIDETLEDKEELHSLFDGITPEKIDDYLVQNPYSYGDLYEYLNSYGQQEFEKFIVDKFNDELSNFEA